MNFCLNNLICIVCNTRMVAYTCVEKCGLSFYIMKCPHCGHMSILLPERYEPAYDEAYFLGDAPYHYIDERGERIIRDIEDRRRIKNIKTFVETGRFLDVGAGLGNLVRIAQEEGFKALGIDASDYAAENGFKVWKADVETYESGKPFDIITMIETIEHFNDPRAALKNCHSLLFDNGLLVMQTANMASLSRKVEGKNCKYFLPGHFHYFSLKNLVFLLKQSGFRIEHIYYGKEDGFIPAFVRKLLAQRSRSKRSDVSVFLKTLALHTLSKINWPFAINPTMTIYARKCSK